MGSPMRQLVSFIILVLLVHGNLAQNDDPNVTLSLGTIVGKAVIFEEDRFINISKQINTFLGVPFAEPPERFEPPRPKEPWTEPWNATYFRSPCFQSVSWPFDYNPTPSEDCLYLNVYAPNELTELAPVMVWIYGGRFDTGTAMTYDYYGVPLAAVGDVIVVTINYRLNIFSRFATGNDDARGNFGMLDQVEALRWVKANIQEFGGDPNRVTIFGESAGGASVNFHLLSPLSKGLFQQAIMQSGTTTAPWAFEPQPENDWFKAQELGKALGCDVTDSSILVDCLRIANATELMMKAAPIYRPGGIYPITLDGVFMKDTPINLYNNGNFSRVPILLGTNEDEGTSAILQALPGFAGSPDPPHIPQVFFETLVASLAAYYGDEDIIQDSISLEYTDWSTADYVTADYFRSFVDVISDSTFACPTDIVARKHAEAGDSPVYKYFMTHDPSRTSIFFEVIGAQPFTPWLGATHGEDIIFVFGTAFVDELAGIHGHNLTDAEKTMSVQTMRYWTNFAKTGDPNLPSSGEEDYPSWPEFAVPGLDYKELSLDFENGAGVRARQCRLWNHYLHDLAEQTADLGGDQERWEEGFASWQQHMELWSDEFAKYQRNDPCGK